MCTALTKRNGLGVYVHRGLIGWPVRTLSVAVFSLLNITIEHCFI